MRFLVLVTDAFGGKGGIAKFNRDLLTALCEYPGCDEVVAIARRMFEEPGPLPAKLTYVTKALDSIPKYMTTVLETASKGKKFDLILCGHIHLLPAAYLPRYFGLRAPLALVLHGTDAWQPSKNPIANWLARKIDAAISVSKVTQERFLTWAQVNGAASFTLPNSIDLSRFSAEAKDSRLLHHYGLDGKKVMMTLGRLEETERYKGVDEVLDVMPQLLKEVPNLVYLVAGEGSGRMRLQEKAKSLGLKGRVTFTGFIPESEKADHYRLADAFVMPGWGEGFGIVYLEAMACGVPVVASKADGSREAVKNGELGILVDPKNPAEIKEGILEALRRPRQVPAGLEDFSFKNFKRRVHEIIEKIQGQNSGTKNSGTGPGMRSGPVPEFFP